MQAYEGYLENGQFFPIGINPSMVGRQRVIMTVLGDEKKELKRQAETWLLTELEKGKKSAEEKGWLSEEEADALIDAL